MKQSSLHKAALILKKKKKEVNRTASHRFKPAMCWQCQAHSFLIEYRVHLRPKGCQTCLKQLKGPWESRIKGLHTQRNMGEFIQGTAIVTVEKGLKNVIYCIALIK